MVLLQPKAVISCRPSVICPAPNRNSALPRSPARSGVRLFGIAVVLPLLAVWLVEARARQAYVAVRGGRLRPAALTTCL